MFNKSSEGRLPYALLALRITCGIFLLQWVIEKFVKPEVTAAIFSHFYGVEGLPVTGAYILGAVQGLIVIGFLVGYCRRVTYGLCLLMHAVSTLSTWKYLISPYDGSNHLFMTAVPVLAAFWALYYLRDRDTCTLDSRLGQAKAKA